PVHGQSHQTERRLGRPQERPRYLHDHPLGPGVVPAPSPRRGDRPYLPGRKDTTMNAITTSAARHRARPTRRPVARLRLDVLEDRTVPSVTLTETEPNSTPTAANAIHRMPETQVIVSGRVGGLGDRDWFRLQLQPGDVLGAAVTGRNGLNPAL